MLEDRRELAPGIILYKTNADYAKSLINDIEAVVAEDWRKAEVVDTSTEKLEGVIQEEARRCFDFPLVGEEIFQSDRPNYVELYNKIDSWIQPAIDDFQGWYNVERIVKGPYILLKYGYSDKFDWHVDDGQRYPRTVSVSAYLNDDYSGGEIEFERFGVSHKPEAGDLVVFSSAFPYSHRVVPVTEGTRYAIVNWYRYANYPEEFWVG